MFFSKKIFVFLKNNMYFCRKLTNPKLKYKYEKNVFCTYIAEQYIATKSQ